MSETINYFIVNRSAEDVMEHLSDLSNIFIPIPESTILYIKDISDKNERKWVVKLMNPFTGETNVFVKSEINEEEIIYRISAGNLVIRYKIYGLDKDNTIIEQFISKKDMAPYYLSKEFYLMKDRIIKSLRMMGNNVFVKEISREEFLKLLSVDPSNQGAQEEIIKLNAKDTSTSPKEITEIQEIKQPIQEAPKKDHNINPVISIHKCSECMFYEETTSYCVILMKKIMNVSEPLCKGESFISRGQ